jgi:hypothetical protein
VFALNLYKNRKNTIKIREHRVIPRGRTSVGGSGGAVPNSRHVEQFEVVDLI